MFFEMLGLLLVFGAILLLCYYTTKFIGRRMSGRTSNKNMKIVETLSLGLDRCLYLILVGNKYFLFFSSKKGLELVSEVDAEIKAEDSDETDEKKANVFDFRRIFESYSGLSDKKSNDSYEGEKAEDPEEKGIIGSIKRLNRINTNNH